MMRLILSATFLALFSSLAAQCPPNDCTNDQIFSTILYAPQCYGEQYLVQVEVVGDVTNWMNQEWLGPGEYTWTIYNSCSSYSQVIEGYDANNEPIYTCVNEPYEIENSTTLLLGEIPCVLNAIVDRNHPSTFGCNDGSFSISAFTNACGDYIAHLYSQDGNYISAAYGNNDQNAVFQNLMQGYYDIVVESQPSGCEEVFTDVALYTPVCESPLQITTVPASAYGCQDGVILIEETDPNCPWTIHVTRSTDGATLLYEQNTWWPTNGNGHQEAILSPVYPGTYIINSIRHTYDFDGNFLECLAWDTVVVEPVTCALDGEILSIVNNPLSSCNTGTIELTATTNTCDGYHIEIKTALGNVVHQAYYNFSGQPYSFSDLLPGDYTVRFFTSDLSFGLPAALCEEIIPFSVPDLGCNNSFVINSSPASNFCNQDGVLTIEALYPSCTFYVYGYRLPENYSSFSYNSSLSPYYVQPNLIPGEYAIQALRVYYDYDGNFQQCETWNYIEVLSTEPLDSDGDGVHMCQGDCDDGNEFVFPGAPPTGSGWDNNCDGFISSLEALECPGDFNGDVIVNTTDLLLFVSSYGCNSACTTGDMNGDLVVNTTDLLLFVSAYGGSCN